VYLEGDAGNHGHTAEIRHVHMRYCVDLDAVVASYLRLSMSATWKMLHAVSLA
jgi:hypothetical protein